MLYAIHAIAEIKTEYLKIINLFKIVLTHCLPIYQYIFIKTTIFLKTKSSEKSGIGLHFYKYLKCLAYRRQLDSHIYYIPPVVISNISSTLENEKPLMREWVKIINNILIISYYYENSFDIMDPPKWSWGHPGVPRPHLGNCHFQPCLFYYILLSKPIKFHSQNSGTLCPPLLIPQLMFSLPPWMHYESRRNISQEWNSHCTINPASRRHYVTHTNPMSEIILA